MEIVAEVGFRELFLYYNKMWLKKNHIEKQSYSMIGIKSFLPQITRCENILFNNTIFFQFSIM